MKERVVTMLVMTAIAACVAGIVVLSHNLGKSEAAMDCSLRGSTRIFLHSEKCGTTEAEALEKLISGMILELRAQGTASPEQIDELERQLRKVQRIVDKEHGYVS